jgi:hypothetical protein
MRICGTAKGIGIARLVMAVEMRRMPYNYFILLVSFNLGSPGAVVYLNIGSLSRFISLNEVLADFLPWFMIVPRDPLFSAGWDTALIMQRADIMTLSPILYQLVSDCVGSTIPGDDLNEIRLQFD